MQTITYTNLRTNLKQNLDEVYQNREPKIITRTDGNNVVLMSYEDYSGLIETTYLLSTDANRNNLQESIKQLNSGQIVKMSL